MVFDYNITQNQAEMAEQAGIYMHLWSPDELGITKAVDLVTPLNKGLSELKANPEKFKEFNPNHPIHFYDGLVDFVDGYIPDCILDSWLRTRRADYPYLVRGGLSVSLNPNCRAINLFGVWFDGDNLFALLSFSHWLPPFLGNAPSLRKAFIPSGKLPSGLARRVLPILVSLNRFVNNKGSGRIRVCQNSTLSRFSRGYGQ